MNNKKARAIRNQIGNPYEKKYEEDPRVPSGLTTRLKPSCGRAIYLKAKKIYIRGYGADSSHVV